MLASPENIVIIKNFISNEHLEIAQRYCESIKTLTSQIVGKNDKISTATEMKLNCPELHGIMQSYINIVKEKIEYMFGRELEKATVGIRRWDVAESQPPHGDGENLDGEPNNTYIVDYGSIMYLNDNYLGGELYFPEYDLEIQPESGMLVFFPSGKYYIHEVRQIFSGVRYTAPHFWIPTKHRRLIDIAKNG